MRNALHPTATQTERAVLVKLITRDGFARHTPGDGNDSDSGVGLEELSALADTAGARVVGQVTQRRPEVDPASFIGRGKVEEVSAICQAEDANLVIFDHDLSPAQVRNLEKVTGCRVIDRTELILDIFARRASTHQAKLQVELAQLEYELPRLRRMWTHLSRIEGGIGLRGPGETQLEVDRRRARERISELKRELKEIARRKSDQTRRRAEFFTVALVGYTNVGKTALMNALTGERLLSENRLFATLDATTRKLELPGGQRVLLTDTVGFIRNIPHHLVASFHATLEEVREADLLLHLADAGQEDVAAQTQSVREVLQELGCGESPVLLVLNKMDLPGAAARLREVESLYGEVLPVSVVQREGITQLLSAIERKVHEQQVRVTLKIPVQDGRALAYLFHRGTVLSREIDGDMVLVNAILGRREVAKLEKYCVLRIP